MNEQSVYPIFLTKLAGMRVVVVGGGMVAQRKVQGLLTVQAAVQVVSPVLTEELQEYHQAERIGWTARPYRAGDLAGAGLAFAATAQRGVNAQVARDAAQLGILCNVVDEPEDGTFHVPAVHRRPGTIVAVGSGGTAPARSKQIRDWIARLLNTSPV